MIDTSNIFSIVVLTVTVFTAGILLGSAISRYYVRKIFEAVKILSGAVALVSKPKDSERENIEAFADFHVANLVWHMSEDGSETEAEALERITKSLMRMDADVRDLAVRGLEQAREVVKKSSADEEEAEAKAELEH